MGLALAAGGVFLLAGLFCAPAIAALLGADADTMDKTTAYLRVILCFAPCFIMNNTLLAFVRNDGNPRLSMTAMLTGSLANIVLDYLFMFPFSMGAAIATGLAPVISMGVLFLHLFSKKSTLSILRCRWSLREAISILSPGVSSFITELSSGIVLMVFNLVILSLAGNIGVAAYGIVANLALVVAAVFTGIAQGLQPLASRSYGAGDGNALKLVFRYGAMLSIVLSVCIYAGANTCWQGIIAIFNSGSGSHCTAGNPAVFCRIPLCRGQYCQRGFFKRCGGNREGILHIHCQGMPGHHPSCIPAARHMGDGWSVAFICIG